jgi:hypothetical protein
MVRIIPTEFLLALDLRQGVSLHVLEEQGGWSMVRVEKPLGGQETKGWPSDWFRQALGSVRLAAGETADSMKLAYLTRNHGIE